MENYSNFLKVVLFSHLKINRFNTTNRRPGYAMIFNIHNKIPNNKGKGRHVFEAITLLSLGMTLAVSSSCRMIIKKIELKKC